MTDANREGRTPLRRGYRCRIARESGRICARLRPRASRPLRLAELCLEEIERESLTVSEACARYEVHLLEVKATSSPVAGRRSGGCCAFSAGAPGLHTLTAPPALATTK